MQSKYIWRWGIYLIGMCSLALGLSLTSQVALGVSPLISIAQAFSTITGVNFGNSTFLLYVVFIIFELIAHWYKKQPKSVFLMDFLQFPLSLVFSRLLNLLKVIIPDFGSDFAGSWLGTIPGRILFVLIAAVFTSIGVAMTVDMKLIPNPGDGIVSALALVSGRELGFCKNCVDFSCVAIAVLIGLICSGKIYGIGIGTVICMIICGRLVAVFNRLFLKKLQALAF